MKRKLCTITLFVAIIASMFGNLDPFFWGRDSDATWNILLSVGYLGAWGWFLYEKHTKKAMWFYRIWWTLSLTGAVLCIELLWLFLPEVLIVAAWPLGAFFLSELFGLSLLFGVGVDFLQLFYVIICAVMFWLGIRKMKKLHL